MDFMGILFLVLSLGYVCVNIWDQWEERGGRSLLDEAGRFLPRRFFYHLVAAEPPVNTPLDAKLTVQHAGSASRCEVCHQIDCFDVESGYCQRCNHHTL